MQLAHPEYLWLFTIYIPLIAWYVWKHRSAFPALGISTVSPYAGLPRSYKEYLIHLFVSVAIGSDRMCDYSPCTSADPRQLAYLFHRGYRHRAGA